MPVKSKAQRRKFAELLVKGEITEEAYERWNREAGRKELPERVTPKTKSGSKSKPKKKTPRPKRKKSSSSTSARKRTSPAKKSRSRSKPRKATRATKS